MNLTRKENMLLRALMTRPGRKKSGCCRCEGLRAVRELLQYYPEKVRFIAVTEKAAGLLQCDKTLLRIVADREFDDIAGTVTSQGVIAVADIPENASGETAS